MDNQYKEVRIMYAGSKYLIHSLLQEFLKFGVPIPNGDNSKSIVVPAPLFKQFAPALHAFPNITINLYSDVYELAKVLTNFDADLIILDERNESEETALNQNDTANDSATDLELDSEKVLHFLSEPKHHSVKNIVFENLKLAIEQFTPRDFIYTMRRIIVILPKEARKTDREFTLGLAQVRAVLVEPSSSVDVFLHATNGLLKYYQNHTKTCLSFSGGGLEGYLYSVGVAAALDNCFVNKVCYDFDVFCGVSSGAMLTSVLAANIRPELLINQILRQGNELEYFGLNTIFDLATSEIVRKGFRLLKAFSTHDIGEAIARFQSAIPVGFFRGERLKQFIERQMKCIGIENNIGMLKKELYIGATEQDTGENIILGEEPWKNIKISQAVRASSALPPFYLPEKINGHWFSDGQISGGACFDHAIKKGAGLVVNVDPMVAYTSNLPGEIMKRGGYFTLLQSVKGLVQSRADSMLRHSMDKNPDVDFISFRPTDDVMEAMAGNPMKYHIHTELVELGYKCTLSQIMASYGAISHKFAKHGFILKSKNEVASL